MSTPASPTESCSEVELDKLRRENHSFDGVEDEKQNLISSNVKTIQNVPATINEEQEDGSKNKSSLSLPHENSQAPNSPSSLTSNNHINVNGNTTSSNQMPLANTISMPKPSLCERSQSDRRKLSVSNIMSFGEQRRRSTSSIFSDMRKMSITNFDSIKSPGLGK